MKHIFYQFCGIVLLCVSLFSQAQTIDIATARTQALEATVTVEGTITAVLGNAKYLQDETAAIVIFNFDMDDVAVGDNMTITGQIDEYQNLLEIVDGGVDDFSYTVNSNGNDLPAPLELMAADAYNEAYEAQLIKVLGLSFSDAGTFSGGTNYTVSDGSGDYLIRIDNSTGIAGANIPTDAVDVVGVLGQYADNHQLFPRSTTDLGIEPVEPNNDEIAIADAKALALGETVSVRGIVTGVFGAVVYMQDETAGVAMFNGDFGGEVFAGDSLRITGQLSEYQNLLQIVNDGGTYNYDILSTGNNVPAAQMTSAANAYAETNEAKLLSISGVSFLETGIFEENTNYTLTDGTNEYSVRISNHTDIADSAIPEGEMTIVGVMGQFGDYQLYPRSTADVGVEDMSNTIDIAEARSMALGETVSIQGTVTAVFGSVAYMQDATAGIVMYNNDFNGVLATGDDLLITGQLSEFNNLLQVVDDEGEYSFEVVSSGNNLPAPVELSAADAFNEAYEAQLLKITGVSFTETGTFEDNANYDITDDSGTYAVRIDNDTDIAGADIPEETLDIIGVLGQYQDTHQLFPRSKVDLGIGEDSNTMTIAEARTIAIDQTVTVQGIVTAVFGPSIYMQDATAGISMYNNDFSGVINTGDALLITGQLSEFNGLLQIVDGGLEYSFEVVSSGNDLPAPLELSAADAFSEAYESQLLKISSVSFTETGTFADNTNYDVTDGMGTYAIRIDNDTEIAGAGIPEAATDIVGVMGQYQDTYQMFPRTVEDLGIEGVDPNEGVMTIAEARAMEIGSIVTIKGIVTNGDEFGPIRYMQDETAGIGVYDFGGVENATVGDSIIVTGPLSEFNNLLQISGGDISYQILNSGNDQPAPAITMIADLYNEPYEGQLVEIQGVTFLDAGTFAGGSNYIVTNDGFSSYTIRINAGTDIAGIAIPTGVPLNIVGIMGQYQDTYQLMPRNAVDLGLEPSGFEPNPADAITIAEARTLSLGATVTVKGIVTNGDEFGVIRYMQDESAGIAVYDPSIADANIAFGDSLLITGQLYEFNNLLEIGSQGGDFGFVVLNSNNTQPEPTITDIATGFSETYEGQVMKFENVSFGVVGEFEGGTNYVLTGPNGEQNQIRVNFGTSLVDTEIPIGQVNVTGLLGQYQDNYQLLPRGTEDIEFVGGVAIFSQSLTQTGLTENSIDVAFATLEAFNTEIVYGSSPDDLSNNLIGGVPTTDHTASITGLEPGQIYYIQGVVTDAEGNSYTTPVRPMATVSESSGDIKVYFNASVNHDVSTGTDAIFLDHVMADTLKAYIGRAKYSIDMCFYSYNETNQGQTINLGIADALNEAADNGVECRFVFDSQVNPAIANLLFPGDPENPAANKSIRPGDLQGIQHNKFLVIDADSPDPNDPLVWTGATNFSPGQLNDDPNNVIILQDQSLARAYTLEMDEMMDGKFGGQKSDNTPKQFIVGGKNVEAYFSPTDPVNAAIKQSIQSADYDLYFAILAFTRDDIAEEFAAQAANPDVFTAGIMDQNGADNEDPYNIMSPVMGDQLIVDNNGYIFHHKYLIADPNDIDSDPQVLTGSHNWTNSAQTRNDENTVVVHDATIANIYYQEWVQRYIDNGGTELVDMMVFVPSENLENKLQLFPNPANATLHVVYGTQNADVVNITLRNAMGQVVYQNQQTADQLSNERFTLDVSHLTTGIYFLEVNNQVQRVVIGR